MCDCNKQAQPERKPHVHAELIKLWAEGAQVQYLDGEGDWQDTGQPSWALNAHYRIKPEPKPMTDLEKYGVEVGDIWKPKSNGNIFVSNVRGCLMNIRGVDTHHSYHNANGVVFDNLADSILVFRRGVVNKL